MGKSRYEKRLEKDLDRWIAGDLIAPENRQLILDDISATPNGWTASGALAILGSVLLALAALSFVAANWADMSDVVRLVVLFGALWGCFLGSGMTFSRGHPAIGHALALLGAALFGVSIVLVAQIFNMSSWRYTVLGIWAAGALATAILTPSRPTLILASILGGSWIWAETYNTFAPGIVWSYLALWAISMAAASRMKSLASANMLGIGLFLWVSFLVWDYSQDDRLGHLQAFCVFILAAGGLAMLFAELRDRQWFGFGTLTNWGSTTALIAGFTLQFPLTRYESFADRITGTEGDTAGRWLQVTGESTADYWLLGLAFAGLLAAVIAWRFISRPDSRALAWPAAFAGILALILPVAAQAMGTDAILLLRILVGAGIVVLAVALILYGSREGRRFTGGIGIALFVAQTLYIYSVTFGDLLDTSLFFLIGGLLLFGLSVAIIRLQKRMTSPAEASS